MGNTRYEVVPAPAKTKIDTNFIYILAPSWTTPSPFRWPPKHYTVRWKGETAVCTSLISPSTRTEVR